MLVLGLRWYLSSRRAANRIEAHLAGVLGAPVRIDDVAIGWVDSTWLGGLAVHEAHDQGAGLPWLTIRETRTDVAAVDWFGNSGPRQIDLRGAAIDLRFDAGGKMLTRLPWPAGQNGWPRLALTDSRILLQQLDRRGQLALDGLEADIVWDAPRLVLAGAVNDSQRGDWKLDGFLTPDSREVFLHLRTDRTRIDQAQLEQLPFVSPNVWREVRIDNGVAAVDLTLRFHLDRPGVSYRLELDVSDARLQVFAIDLKTERTEGKVVVEDERVELRGVKGQTAGGQIATTGDLVFGTEGSRMTFAIDVRQAELHRLPKKWPLPRQFAGKVTGRAHLLVTTKAGQVRTTGDGRGSVENPFGLPWPRSVPIRMQANGDGIRFGLDLQKNEG